MDDDDDVATRDDEASVVDRLRDMPVGVADPNLIGDAGPTDVPPGSDPPPAPAGDVPDEEP